MNDTLEVQGRDRLVEVIRAALAATSRDDAKAVFHRFADE